MNENSIFINCPFDNSYLPLLRVMLFAAKFYGLEVMIASSDMDSKSDRLPRIIKLMKKSRYSIHDLSKMKSTAKNEYYRMNMPFELGLDYGLNGSKKVFLIFENEQYKLKKALSDINGWDVRSHNNDSEKLMMEFRKWIVAENKSISKDLKSYSASDIWYQYNDFYGSFSDHMNAHHMKDEEISVAEYMQYIDTYLEEHRDGYKACV